MLHSKPAGQSIQTIEFVSFEYVPNGQGIGDVPFSTGQYFPKGHGVQDDWPGSEKVPFAQLSVVPDKHLKKIN